VVAGLLALPERSVLAVSGPQRSKFLHNLLSNDVEGRKPGQGALASLMDAKGHLLVLLRVLVCESEILLEMPRERLAAVEALLVHYKVGTPVRFSARPVAIDALLGSGAAETLAAVSAPVPEGAPQSHLAAEIAGQGVRIVRASDLPAGAFVLHVAPEGSEAVAAALRAAGASFLDRADFDALRIEEGRPLYGVDVAEDNLLHETGLVHEYHSAAKGCYVGQEVVARLEARGGNVNRLLRGLTLAAPALAGAAISAAGQEVGRITTAAVSRRRGPIAMGYVHRKHAAPGTAVEVDGALATVVSLPMGS